MQINVALWRKEAKQTQVFRLTLLVGLLFLSLILGVTQGALSINLLSELSSLEQAIILDVRLPRVLMTAATGAGLAICGLVLQSICRNPLADPGIIGVSSGAALFAAFAIYLGSTLTLPKQLSVFFIPSMAFIGAFLALTLLLSIASYKKSINTLVMILSGVAINAGADTLLGFITFIADDNTLRLITFWQLGSYSGIGWQQALLASAFTGFAFVLFRSRSEQITLLQMGEQHAHFAGVNVDKLKLTLLITVAAVTAVCVSFTGIVGFIGLVVPHICRMFVGGQLNMLLPTSAVLGAIIVALADVCARLIIVPAELPIGLLTSAIGVPFFLWLIVREKRKYGYD